MSDNFYKWKVLSYRQSMKDQREVHNFLQSGEVITIRHAETSGILCYDELSHARLGDPAYVREYRGTESDMKVTTNCLFEIEIHYNGVGKDAVNQGNIL